MFSSWKSWVAIALGVVLVAGAAVAVWKFGTWPFGKPQPLRLEGSVLRKNSDPSERMPLAGVTVTAKAGALVAMGKSDPSGFFSLTLHRELKKNESVLLRFEMPDYQSFQMVADKPGNQLYVIQMTPVNPVSGSSKRNEEPLKPTVIKNVVVRYSFKDEATMAVGSYAKRFAVFNNGNAACQGHLPCSPDGRWKASLTNLPLDAEQGNEFRNVRVSCIAGPCHFTRIEKGAPDDPAQRMTISILNWSDTTEFLVEADIIRTMSTDLVQHSYPFILGDAMNFTMPPTSEGPTVEANVNGQYIVFPLGPLVRLDWATCSMELSAERNKIYRCQLKPGYQFQ